MEYSAGDPFFRFFVKGFVLINVTKNDMDHYFPIRANLIAPQGIICCLVDAIKKHDLTLLTVS